jgi:hypothetical protein
LLTAPIVSEGPGHRRMTQGAFYGWPYAYWGRNEDPRRTGEWPDIVATAIAPDFAVGAHTAALGLVFGDRLNFPGRYAWPSPRTGRSWLRTTRGIGSGGWRRAR